MATYSQLQSFFYERTKTNSTSMPAATLNLYMQTAENDVISKIMQADGRFQYDDSNYSDTPIATANLVSGQQDYSMSTSQIRVLGVSVLGNTNIWRKLIPFDPDDITDIFGPLVDRAQFLATPGLPLYYDVQGQSIYLYPAPDNGISVTLTAGLKFYFQRTPLLFDYTTNTFTDSTGSASSAPGFNPLYHDLIPLKAAYDYCVTNMPSLAPGYFAEIQRKEQSLILDYSKRDKDERQIITPAPIRFR